MVLHTLRKKFLEFMKVQDDDAMECSCLVMLYLCIVELLKSDPKGVRKTLGLGEDSCCRDVLEDLCNGYNPALVGLASLASGWSNDVESLVFEIAKKSYQDSPVVNCDLAARIDNNNTVYDLIYSWLKEEYGLSFSE